MTQPPAADGIPGRQHLTGYRLRGYRHAVATLAASRTAQRLTQAEISEPLGCTQTAVSYWLTGKRTATGPALFALADALGYDLALIPREDR